MNFRSIIFNHNRYKKDEGLPLMLENAQEITLRILLAAYDRADKKIETKRHVTITYVFSRREDVFEIKGFAKNFISEYLRIKPIDFIVVSITPTNSQIAHHIRP